MPNKKFNKTRKSKKPVSRQSKTILNKCSSKIKNHAAEPSTFFNYANELYKSGNTAAAIDIYKKGLDRNPYNITALINFSIILITMHEFAKAIFHLNRAIVRMPDQYFAYIYRSVSYLGLGKKAVAYRDFKTVYEKYPDRIHHFKTLDKNKFPQIDFEEAMEYCLPADAGDHLSDVIFFPSADCPGNEICLMKAYCVKKQVCPQNDMSLLAKSSQPEIVSELDFMEIFGNELASGNQVTIKPIPIEHYENGFLKLLHFNPHRIGKIQKLFQYLQNFKKRLIALLSYLFLCVILPLNEAILECEFIIDI